MTNRKVGGIRFIKIGRLSMSYSVSKAKPQAPAGALRALDGLIAALVMALVAGSL